MAILSNIGYSWPPVEVIVKKLNLTGFCASSDKVCENSIFAEEFSLCEITLLRITMVQEPYHYKDLL